MSRKKIVCLTPVSHLDGVLELMNEVGEVSYYPDLTKDELRVLLNGSDFEYLFVNPNKQGFVIDGSVLENSKIKVINTCSTGTNHIDIEYCKKKHIEIWSLTKDFELIDSLPSTAELAFGLMCCLCRNIIPAFDDVKHDHWSYENFIGRQLKDLSILIVGYGRLGKMMEKFCRAFDMNIRIYDPPLGYLDLQSSLSCSDVVSLHVHADPSTSGMVDSSFISQMKKGSFLINTSRGELVDELAVISAIKAGVIGGYGCDVIRDEFNEGTLSPLVEFSKSDPRIIITPHVGGMTWEGQAKAFKWAVMKFKNMKVI